METETYKVKGTEVADKQKVLKLVVFTNTPCFLLNHTAPALITSNFDPKKLSKVKVAHLIRSIGARIVFYIGADRKATDLFFIA